MRLRTKNSLGTQSVLRAGSCIYQYFRLADLERSGWSQVNRLPVSLKILLENLLRHEDGVIVTTREIEALLQAAVPGRGVQEVPFLPSRVLLQDFTGIPAIVDLAAMRDAMVVVGGDPERINPLVRADLVIDHSVQADEYGHALAFQRNIDLEFARNRERYSLLRWAQDAFRNLTVLPPGKGIVHQVNLEHFAAVVHTERSESHATPVAYPDTLVGTDSHTTMINALGVLGWGVGGIEAEAVLLGQPYYIPIPQVVGVKLEGALREGVTATDLVLEVTRVLRAKDVVGKFVEFHGPALAHLSLPDRATVANMAPEYGATVGFFPIDGETLRYLRATARDEHLLALVEAYTKEQGLFWSPESPEPLFADRVVVDLSTVEPGVAGPRRPQDRLSLGEVGSAFREALAKPAASGGYGLATEECRRSVAASLRGEDFSLHHGSVVIAAITSCTNTSNPELMVAAGLLAQKASALGLRSKPWVKTSLAPGSRVVMDYFTRTGLMQPLEALGFHLVGFGCTTCIGNSGPLPDTVQRAVEAGRLVVAAVLSGNRNFEGRIHSTVAANYLASPALVVAYALAGTVTIDLESDPLGRDGNGRPVYLRDIWPSRAEVCELLDRHLDAELFHCGYADVYTGDAAWKSLPVQAGSLFAWDEDSTYIRRPPFLSGVTGEVRPPRDIVNARVLLLLGDSVTTDHISPAGSIPEESPAGLYLRAHQVPPEAFNTYGSRRGNHEVMMRGTFANTRLKNRLVDGVSGGFTRHHPGGECVTLWEAAERYRRDGVALLVLAGKDYGTGSSRDWAAKGTALLGVRAVIAESFERIHRSNLIGMGVLPLQFLEGESAQTLGLTGEETFTVRGLEENLRHGGELSVEVTTSGGARRCFAVRNRLDTLVELDYYRHGGILPKMLRALARLS
jgi:aconitate hydratase